MGAIASHADDELYVGLPQFAPVDMENAGDLDCLNAGSNEELERHTSEEEGMARGPMMIDPVATGVTPEVRADVGETTHQDRPPIFLSVYPGWILITPPMEMRPQPPDWS